MTFSRSYSQKNLGTKIHGRPRPQLLELLIQDTFHCEICIKPNQQTAKRHSMQEYWSISITLLWPNDTHSVIDLVDQLWKERWCSRQWSDSFSKTYALHLTSNLNTEMHAILWPQIRRHHYRRQAAPQCWKGLQDLAVPVQASLATASLQLPGAASGVTDHPANSDCRDHDLREKPSTTWVSPRQ